MNKPHQSTDIILPSIARAFYNFMMENTTCTCLVNTFNPNNRGRSYRASLGLLRGYENKFRTFIIVSEVVNCVSHSLALKKHRITEWLNWRTSDNHLFHLPCSEQGELWHIAHGRVQLTFECLQGWWVQNSSDNLLQCLNSKNKFFLHLIEISYISISAHCFLGLSLGTAENVWLCFFTPCHQAFRLLYADSSQPFQHLHLSHHLHGLLPYYPQ